VLTQLARLVVQRRDSVLSRGARLPQAIAVLLHSLDTPLDDERASPEVADEIIRSLQRLHSSASASTGVSGDELMRSVAEQLGPELSSKLLQVLDIAANRPHLSFSPLATAPIHDVLLRR
jgi:hypothetical protein